MYHLLADQKRREEQKREAEEKDRMEKSARERAQSPPPPDNTLHIGSKEDLRDRTRRFSLVNYTGTPVLDSTTEISPLPVAGAHQTAPHLLPPAEKDKSRRHSLNLTSNGVAASPGGSVDASRAKTPADKPNPKEGFLAKIFGRGAGASSNVSVVPVAAAVVPQPVPVAAPASAEPKPPPMKGAFNSHTVTSKPINEIQDQIQRALDKLGLKYELSKKGFGYKVRLEIPGSMPGTVMLVLGFSIKICAIEKFDMKGLKFKRTAGDLWEFQKMHQQIVDNLNI